LSVKARWSAVRELLRPRTRWRAFREGRPIGVPRALPGWEADFNGWVRRGSGRQAGAYPDLWRSRVDLPVVDPAKVGVVVHVFYPDLAEELFDRLRAMPVAYDLFVTNASGTPIEVPQEMGPLAQARVLEVSNHGRDILPLVSLVNAGYLDPYLVVLKMHTKRSAWRSEHVALGGTGEQWRAQLLDSLLGGPENIMAVLSAFAERPDLGLVTADGSVLGPDFWGDNEDHAANLLRRLELILDPDGLRFAAGSMYWVRGFALQGLRALNLSSTDFEPELGQVNATTAHAIERLLGALLTEAGLSILERSALPTASVDGWRRFGPGPLRPRARIVPFYLPQFHPVEENDRWWGEGFTEWTNVASAQPVYEGQHQPRIPRDLGFYDLRLDDVRVAQLSMSSAAGISGFMYYHYWFAGRPLLDTPIRKLLDSDIPQPFCVMWANENWTRRWDGRETDVLMAQDHQLVPAADFIDDVMPLLADERYMTIGRRKIVAVYRPGQIPDLAETIASWRDRARRSGVGELFVMNVDVDLEFGGLVGPLESHGLDGSLGFPPHNHRWTWLPHEGLGVDERFTGNLLSYQALVKDAERRLRTQPRPSLYPGVMVAFDNTPRRQWDSDVWYGSNPYTFRRWLASAVSSVLDRDPEERVVFVNAWNEWAEGAVLEPTNRYGRSFLMAVRDVAFA